MWNCRNAKDMMQRKRRRALRTKRETYIRVCSLFPTENARSEHTEWHYLLHPVPKASDTISSRGSRNPLLSLFFTRSRINPTCRVFRSNDAARGNVSLYLKIDIYAHPGADSRYSEDTSRFEGHRTLVFFFATFVSGFSRGNLSTSKDAS